MLTRKRRLADTVGFAHRKRQIEAVVQRIAAQDGAKLERILEGHKVAAGDRWRLAIAPRDDYAYARPRQQRFAIRSVTPPSGFADRRRMVRKSHAVVLANTHFRCATSPCCIFALGNSQTRIKILRARICQR